MKKAVVLLSGGLDSATCLAIAKSQGYECFTISFNYGQKQICELKSAAKIAECFNSPHKIIDIPCLADIAASALTQDNLEIPDYSGDGDIPITYVPARNTIFLSFALSYAESINADYIYIGASSIDYSGYPDCRPEYFDIFQQLINTGTKAGIQGNSIKIITPLAQLNKAETIAQGLKLGVNYGDTITCYRANSNGEACGSCDSCYLRKKGFAEAGITDPTIYTT